MQEIAMEARHFLFVNDIFYCVCYTSRGALAGTRISLMGPPWRIDPTTHRTMSERSTSELAIMKQFC